MRKLEEAGEKGILTQTVKKKIADNFNVPVSYVETVSGSYSFDSGRDLVCRGLPCALHRGRKEDDAVSKLNAKDESCLGYCDHAPVVRMDGRFFRQEGSEYTEIEESIESRVIEKRRNISDYIRNGGYSQLKKVLDSSDRSFVSSAVEKSSLRGMGGAGFPVALKWKSFSSNNDGRTYLLVNAHEGEPGTFKDRKILEENPHLVIEGALISALANGIPSIVIGLKKEYAWARENLLLSLEEMKGYMSANYESLPDITVESVAGSYVTGEETALMEAVEGSRSEPRLRPPFPTEKGLYGRPTLVQNVETLSLIPKILGGESIDKSYCLTGDVESPGTYRLNMGLTAEELITSRGKSDSGKIKAFLPGGLSGGVLPSSYLNTPLDFEGLKKAGAGFGTGAFIALSDERCIVDSMKVIEGFFAAESCGKCIPCRLGTHEISEILNNLSEGTATEGDLKWASEVANSMMEGSICALGQAAGKVFLDSIKHFGDEINSHLKKECEAGVCRFGGD